MRIILTLTILMCVQLSYANKLVEYYRGNIKLTQDEIQDLIKEIFEENPSSYKAAVAHYQQGVLHRKAGMNLNAYLSYENSMNVLKSVDTVDYLLEAAILKNQGVILKQSGLYEMAIERYNAGLEPASKHSKKLELSARYNLGRALAYTNTEAALDEFIKLIQEDNQKYKARGYREIGKLLVESKKYDTAMYYFGKALEINSNLQEKAWIYHDMANLSYKAGDYKQQEAYLLKALSLNQSDNRFTSLMDLGECYMLLGEKEKSQEALIKAEALYESRSLTEDNIKVYDWLRMVAKNNADEIQYAQLQIQELKKLVSLQAKLQEQHRKVSMLNTIDHIAEKKESGSTIDYLVLVGKILLTLLVILGMILGLKKIRAKQVEKRISKFWKIRD